MDSLVDHLVALHHMVDQMVDHMVDQMVDLLGLRASWDASVCFTHRHVDTSWAPHGHLMGTSWTAHGQLMDSCILRRFRDIGLERAEVSLRYNKIEVTLTTGIMRPREIVVKYSCP